MIFSPLEILLCMAPFMLIIFSIGAVLLAQNISIRRRELRSDSIECPQCRRLLNQEAYFCRFCRKELYEHIQS